MGTDRAVNYLLMARKAGYLAIGEERAGAAVRTGKSRVLLTASDASDNAKKRAEGFVFGRNQPLIILPYTKAELSRLLGKAGCSMIAVTDIGLASAFVSAMAEQNKEYAPVSEEIGKKNVRAQARRHEAKAHIRNKKLGKRRQGI